MRPARTYRGMSLLSCGLGAARLATRNRGTALRIRAEYVGRKVQVKELVGQETIVRSVFRRCEGPTAKTLNGPVQVGESIAFRTLASVPDCIPCRIVVSRCYKPTPGQ